MCWHIEGDSVFGIHAGECGHQKSDHMSVGDDQNLIVIAMFAVQLTSEGLKFGPSLSVFNVNG